MKKGDRIKTTVGLSIIDEKEFLEGKILSIDNQKCLDGSVFERITIKLDDGRILPCIREELEVINNWMDNLPQSFREKIDSWDDGGCSTGLNND